MNQATKYLAVFILTQLRVEAAMEGFVVGGEETVIWKYTHSAFLSAHCNGDKWVCGAAILNQRLLLTAAHCVEHCEWNNNFQNTIIVFVGNSDLRKVSIKRIIIDYKVHKDFYLHSMENDIAVAMVRKDFPLGPNVQRIVITKQYPVHTKQGYVAGWGIVQLNMQVNSMILKHVRQTVRSFETCSQVGRLHKGMFCAGSTEKNAEHPSNGDSGSALVTPRGYHQMGLVSFYIKKYPALNVYTNVSYYFNWIHTNAHSLFCQHT